MISSFSCNIYLILLLCTHKTTRRTLFIYLHLQFLVFSLLSFCFVTFIQNAFYLFYSIFCSFILLNFLSSLQLQTYLYYLFYSIFLHFLLPTFLFLIYFSHNIILYIYYLPYNFYSNQFLFMWQYYFLYHL